MKIVYNTIFGIVVQEMETAPEFEHIVLTNEVQSQINGMVRPILLDGEIVETATDEETELYYQNSCPQEVSSARFWYEVYNLWGIQKSHVLTIVNSFDEVTATKIKIMMEASIFERTNPMLLMVAQVYGKTSQELFQIFLNANQPLNV